MSAPKTARDHALRVAALEALKDAVTKEYEKARTEAEDTFAATYTQDANDRVMVMLPDGEKIGQVTIKAPPPVVSMLNGGLEHWAEEHIGGEAFEEYLPDAIAASREVLAIVKAAKPELLGRRLRPGTAKKLMADLLKAEPVPPGFLLDADSGDREQVAEVSPGQATGAFAFTGRDGDARRARIMAALLGGDPELRELVGFGPLAIEGGASDAA